MFRVTISPIIRSTWFSRKHDTEQQESDYLQLHNDRTTLLLTNLQPKWASLPVAIYSLCTPDEGWDCHPKHVELAIAKNKNAIVASCWTSFTTIVRILDFWNVLSRTSRVYRFRPFEGTYGLLSQASNGPNNVMSHPQMHRFKYLKLLSESLRTTRRNTKFHNLNRTVYFWVINGNMAGDGCKIQENTQLPYRVHALCAVPCVE